MAYTVGKIAEMLRIPPSTIRYYDKKGLLPFVARTQGGIRQFSDADLERMKSILLLRRFGMSIQEIETYVRLEEQGAATVSQRLDMLQERRLALEEEIRVRCETLEILEKTCQSFGG